MDTQREEPREQRAGWYELFFDLVFVVFVSVLAARLHGDPGPGDFGAFVVLFFPAWWAWANLMVTVDLFGPENPHAQAVLLGAMPGIGLMAAAAPQGLGDRAWAYALGAAWVRLATFVLWYRRSRLPGSALPTWRPVLYCVLPAALWAVSAVVPGAGRFVLWGVAMAVEVVLLVVRRGVDTGFYERLSVEHLVERISLFVVIVLGESVFTVVATLAGHFTGPSGTAALLGFVVVAELAVVFFLWGTSGAARGLARAQAGRSTRAIRDTVMYLPFVLVSGITVIAAALGTAVSEPAHVLPPGARWALCGGVLAYYTANAAIALRYGDGLRTVALWYLPCPLLTFGLLLPAALLLPAWAAVGCAALLVLVMTSLAKRRARAAGRSPAPAAG
ncbi:low temperature requirement protein A [Kitasatospora sp. NPDC059571]|uniref:low temperature requirement protein A n=1 Tax=Kitasatospora sp. NPDC059571 TaxID=3346871 RepID=UPI00369F29F6